jgi:4-alpha-glucanotransferase
VNTVNLGESVTKSDTKKSAGKSGISAALENLAEKYGIGTSYIGSDDSYQEISESVLRQILGIMGVEADTDEQITAHLDRKEIEKWTTPFQKTIIEIVGYGSEVDIYLKSSLVDDVEKLGIRIVLENGEERAVLDLYESLEEKVIDGVKYEHRMFALPKDLPAGYHHICIQELDYCAHLIVTPEVAPTPAKQAYGFMTQLYSQRSHNSWGIGDFEDLRVLAKNAHLETGADFLLVNPTHADFPILPQTPSPYLPVSRHFLNPLYIRPESIFEYALIPKNERECVDDLSRMARALNGSHSSIERNTVWSLKKEALRIIFKQGINTSERLEEFERFKNSSPKTLTLFAVWCVCCDKFGALGDWRQMKVSDPLISETALAHSGDVEFYRWLQWIAHEQLEYAHLEMKKSGAAIGLVADLAVGVHPDGADTWSQASAFIAGVSVGAPPDVYNQQGQDWSQPPLNPADLDATGYAIFRDLVRALFKTAGAIRIDHMLGLFRLWWIPHGNGAKDGAYIHYNHDALIGILCLEAQRCGGVIIGEDLGVVPSGAFNYLKSRQILGTSILFFERDKHKKPTPVETLRKYCFATVATHDLPPTLGYLRQEHVRLREALGLLTEDARKVQREAEEDFARTVRYLQNAHFLDKDHADDELEISIALQRSLFSAPSLLIAFSFADFVGESRAQNQPGTSDEYPNWRVPLEDINGELVYNEELFSNEIFKKFMQNIEQIDKYRGENGRR